MKERMYRGFYDNGQDIGEIEYWSVHRNFSKDNMEDLKNYFMKKHGVNEYYRVLNHGEFKFGYRLEDYE